MKNTAEKIDRTALPEKIRQKYGSVAAFCLEVPIHPRLFYKVLAKGLGERRRQSVLRTALERLEAEGLLKETAEEYLACVNGNPE
jgi:hypothetical protein